MVIWWIGESGIVLVLVLVIVIEGLGCGFRFRFRGSGGRTSPGCESSSRPGWAGEGFRVRGSAHRNRNRNRNRNRTPKGRRPRAGFRVSGSGIPVTSWGVPGFRRCEMAANPTCFRGIGVGEARLGRGWPRSHGGAQKGSSWPGRPAFRSLRAPYRNAHNGLRLATGSLSG